MRPWSTCLARRRAATRRPARLRGRPAGRAGGGTRSSRWPGVSGLVPAAFGSASRLRVGDTVLAIGSPLGLAGSVTSGIVSALHRTITVGSQSSQPYNGTLGQSSQSASIISNMIQTDTAINPGNSGGALVNDAGQVVGITTAIASTGGGYIGQQSGSIGVGFAIPAETASRIAAQLAGG